MLIWDTAGQEKYHCITRTYFKDVDGCFLVFDLTNRESFESVPRWIKEIMTYGSGNEVRLLIGNKRDLADHDPYRSMDDLDSFLE